MATSARERALSIQEIVDKICNQTEREFLPNLRLVSKAFAAGSVAKLFNMVRAPLELESTLILEDIAYSPHNWAVRVVLLLMSQAQESVTHRDRMAHRLARAFQRLTNCDDLILIFNKHNHSDVKRSMLAQSVIAAIRNTRFRTLQIQFPDTAESEALCEGPESELFAVASRNVRIFRMMIGGKRTIDEGDQNAPADQEMAILAHVRRVAGGLEELAITFTGNSVLPERIFKDTWPPLSRLRRLFLWAVATSMPMLLKAIRPSLANLEALGFVMLSLEDGTFMDLFQALLACGQLKWLELHQLSYAKTHAEYVECLASPSSLNWKEMRSNRAEDLHAYRDFIIRTRGQVTIGSWANKHRGKSALLSVVQHDWCSQLTSLDEHRASMGRKIWAAEYLQKCGYETVLSASWAKGFGPWEAKA